MSASSHDFRMLLDLAKQATLLKGQENWSSWKKSLPIILQADGVSYDIVIGKTECPKEAAEAKIWVTKNTQARTIIWTMVHASLRPFVEGYDSGSKLYEALRKKYEKSFWARRVGLRTALHTVIHDPDEKMEEYTDQFMRIKQQLEDMGETIPSSYLKDVILSNLHERYAHVRTNLLAQATGEPDLETVLNVLHGSQGVVNFNPETVGQDALGSPNVKSEPEDSALAARARFSRGKEVKTGSGSSGGGKAGTRGSGYSGRSGTGDNSHTGGGSGDSGGGFDWNGKHWGDMSGDGCHRCGGQNHKAAWCVADMPEEVKRWCLNRTRHEDVHHILEYDDPGNERSMYVSHRWSNSSLRRHSSGSRSPANHSSHSNDSYTSSEIREHFVLEDLF